MIDIEQHIELKKVLGGRFAPDVKKILLQKHIYVKGAETYSSGFISHVLNGRYENAAIEEALYEVYEMRKAQKELLEQRKAALLNNNKKPVAGPPQV